MGTYPEMHEELLARLVKGLRVIYGDLVVQIVLYGPVARGAQF